MRHLRTGMLLLGLLVCCGALLGTAARRPSADAQTAQTAPAMQQDDRAPLFPALDTSRIQAILIETQDSRLEFHTFGAGKVSVNGRRADEQVYKTLVNQIAALPVAGVEPFAGDRELLMTLTIDTGSARHVACFYEDGGTGEEAYILCGPQDAPCYYQTDGWRVGMLMMTCEGTRIQDERGNETPAS